METFISVKMGNNIDNTVWQSLDNIIELNLLVNPNIFGDNSFLL